MGVGGMVARHGLLACSVISSMPYDNTTHIGIGERIARSRRGSGGRKDQVNQEIPGSLLLDPGVLADPYPLYARLREEAPVWQVAGTEVFVVSTFDLLVEASGRVEDFSSAMQCLLYRDETGVPGRFTFGDAEQKRPRYSQPSSVRAGFAVAWSPTSQERR